MPQVPERFAKQVCSLYAKFVALTPSKPPGVSETLDWITLVTALDQMELVEGQGTRHAWCVTKYQDDVRSKSVGTTCKIQKVAERA